MRKLMLNKKGQLGMDTAKKFVLAIMAIAVISFAVIIVMNALNNSGALTAGSVEANQSTDLLRNVTTGVSGFFSNASTWFTLLSVTIIILIIAVVILVVGRFGGSGGGGGL